MMVFMGGTAVTCQVDATLDLSQETFDTSCKDSGSWSTVEPGDKSWSISGMGRLDWAASNGFDDLHDAFEAGTKPTFMFSDGTTGNKKFTGTGLITKLTLKSSGKNAPVDFDFEVTGSGALVKAAIT